MNTRPTDDFFELKSNMIYLEHLNESYAELNEIKDEIIQKQEDLIDEQGTTITLLSKMLQKTRIQYSIVAIAMLLLGFLLGFFSNI